MSFVLRWLRLLKAYVLLAWRALFCRGWAPPCSLRLPASATKVLPFSAGPQVSRPWGNE